MLDINHLLVVDVRWWESFPGLLCFAPLSMQMVPVRVRASAI